MKKLLFILLLSPLFSLAQYRESGDTIFINNKVLVPGDTVHLGMGSDLYKNFVFVTHVPNKKALTNAPLSKDMSMGFMIYKGKKLNKIAGKKMNYPTFFANGIDNIMSHFYIALPQAIAAKEVSI